ncbi:conserved Plasmodium protein, unknown function [Plasmodium ovale]|uniref:Uncharacterized protein n=1 Tax=Plasmodium ovale TaxID=36330 RepID=A0A1D3U8B5_PLAOA|nr:conserved Plasmodium protein, unknown function [Plasmodium ovale]
MNKVFSYRFKKKPPILKSDLEENKEEWSVFIKYMDDLKNVCKLSNEKNEYGSDDCSENDDNSFKNLVRENIEDIIKLKRWNGEMEFEAHPIYKESSSDNDSYSVESGSVLNFNKYSLLQNNIYSNNANSKKQKVREKSSNYMSNENYEMKKEEKKNIFKDYYKNRGKNKKCGNLHKKSQLKNKNHDKLDRNDDNYVHDDKMVLHNSLTKLNEQIYNKKNKHAINTNYKSGTDCAHPFKHNDNFSYEDNENVIQHEGFLSSNGNYKYNELHRNRHTKGKNRKKSTNLNIERMSPENGAMNPLQYCNNSDSRTRGSRAYTGDAQQKGEGDKNCSGRNKVYEEYTNRGSNLYGKNKSGRRKNTETTTEKAQKRGPIDGSYAYNYAYLNNSNESSTSSSNEAGNGTIMNLEEEINNYNFGNFM